MRKLELSSCLDMTKFPSNSIGCVSHNLVIVDDRKGKMAFRQFCCKKKKWRWLATQNHAKLVYYIVHTETKSSKEIVH